jgi:hypothetical protein
MWYTTAFNKFAASFYAPGQAAWISPLGEVFDTGGDTHQGWMFSNQEYVDGETGVFSDIYEQMREDQDAYRSEELERLNDDIAYYEAENDPDELESLNRARKEKQEVEEEMGDVDPSSLNVSRLVTNLIMKGWLRKVDKYGKVIYESRVDDDDNALDLIEHDILKDMQEPRRRMVADTPIVLEEPGQRSWSFRLGDWVQSGMTLREWMNSGSANIEYGRAWDR